jgi:hypothetical protein
VPVERDTLYREVRREGAAAARASATAILV